ncbi:unnamed protein product [Rhodiola kirilowii]
MRQLLFARFLPPDYEETLYQRYHNCRQGSRSVSEYTEEFYRLSSRCFLQETQDQLVARFVNGLQVKIQDRLLQTIWTLDEVVRLATKVEAQINRSTPPRFTSKNVPNSPLRHIEHESSLVREREDSRSTPVTETSTHPNQTAAKILNSSNNSYAKTYGGKCYRCGQMGHFSNSCPARKQVNMVEHLDVPETQIEEVFISPDDVVADDDYTLIHMILHTLLVLFNE